MKKLELNQMENLEGGKALPCSDAIGLGGIVLGATGFSPLGWVGFAALMLACE